jgi:hypothetical protein
VKTCLLLSVLLLSLPGFAQFGQNGPPDYAWALHCVPTGAPDTTCSSIAAPTTGLFSSTDAAGTVKQDPSINNGANGGVIPHIMRLTDPTTSNCGAFNAGEDIEEPSNTDETVWAVPSSCGLTYLISVDPIKFKYLATSASHFNLPCKTFWSRVQNNVIYCLLDKKQHLTVNGSKVTGDGMTTYRGLLAYNSALDCGFTTCPDVTKAITWSLYASASTDCTEGAGQTIIWNSTLSVENSDDVVEFSISTTGPQNTGHITFVDNVHTKTCQTVDWLGNAANPHNPIVYESLNGTVKSLINGFTGKPWQCVFSTIHNTNQVNDWIQVAYEAGTGAECAGGGAGGPTIWNHTGITVYPIGLKPQHDGHNTMDERGWYGADFGVHLFSNPAAFVKISVEEQSGCTTCRDWHGEADRASAGVNPVIGAQGGVGSENMGIVIHPLAVAPNLNEQIRFGKCYSSGINVFNIGPPPIPQNLFEAEYCEGATGQKRISRIFASDMLGQLGTFMNGKVLTNRSDAFLFGLAGQ